MYLKKYQKVRSKITFANKHIKKNMVGVYLGKDKKGRNLILFSVQFQFVNDLRELKFYEEDINWRYFAPIIMHDNEIEFLSEKSSIVKNPQWQPIKKHILQQIKRYHG